MKHELYIDGVPLTFMGVGALSFFLRSLPLRYLFLFQGVYVYCVGVPYPLFEIVIYGFVDRAVLLPIGRYEINFRICSK